MAADELSYDEQNYRVRQILRRHTLYDLDGIPIGYVLPEGVDGVDLRMVIDKTLLSLLSADKSSHFTRVGE